MSARLWLALLTLYVVWGSTYLAIKLTVETIPPLLGAGARFAVAGLLLGGGLAAVSGLGRFRMPRRDLLSALGVSLFTLFAAFSLLMVAQTEVPSGIAALLIASVPLWAVVLRSVTGKHVSRATALAVLVGFGGVAVVALPGTPAEVRIGWMLVVLAAALCEAAGSFFMQRFPLPDDALVTTAVQMAFAGLLTLAVGLAVGEGSDLEFAKVSGRSLAGLAFLIGPGSVLGYSAFVWVLRNAPLTTATTYAYVNPVVALLLGWAIVEESLSPIMLAGAGLILVSVAVVLRQDAEGPRGGQD